MGLAQSALPELARLSLQFTLLPLVMSLWFHNRAQVGWAVSTATIGWYQYVVRYGLNTQNPMTYVPYTGTDLTQATYIYFVVFGTLLWVCAMCGTGIAWLLDMPYPIPAEALLPVSPGHVITEPYTADKNEQRLGQQDAALTANGLSAYGFSDIPRPWAQFLVTIIGFILSCALPFIILEQVWSTSYWGAWLGAVLIALVFHLLFGVYLHFKATLYIYGATAANMKERELMMNAMRKDDDTRATDPDVMDKEQLYRRTIWHVWKFILVTGGICVLGLVLFGGIAIFSDPAWVDTMWIMEIVVIGALLIIIAIIVFIYSRVMRSRFEATLLANGGSSSSSDQARSSPPEEPEGEGDSGPAGQSTTTTTTGKAFAKYGSKARGQAADSFLGNRKTH